MYNKIYCVVKLPVASIWRSDQLKRVSACLFENDIAVVPVNRSYEVKIGIVNIITYCVCRMRFIRKSKGKFTAVSRHLKNGLIDIVLVEVIRTYVELGRQVVYPVNYGKRNILGYGVVSSGHGGSKRIHACTRSLCGIVHVSNATNIVTLSLGVSYDVFEQGVARILGRKRKIDVLYRCVIA